MNPEESLIGPDNTFSFQLGSLTPGFTGLMCSCAYMCVVGVCLAVLCVDCVDVGVRYMQMQAGVTNYSKHQLNSCHVGIMKQTGLITANLHLKSHFQRETGNRIYCIGLLLFVALFC